MSVLDNIRYARIDATESEVEGAAEAANAHLFINELEQGYHSEVNKATLSGGQKQRICIARAILANTPILLLDEATASLDTETERLVQETLEKCRHGKTMIIVAHRLATVKGADRILVMDQGRIVESGTHDELLSRGGHYSRLVKGQLQ